MSDSVEEPPNILLIVLDSVRAKNTSIGGYERQTTPYLRELAQEATLYEQARAPSIWSLPSHVSLFTGESPHVHGVNTDTHTLEQGHTIWEYLESEFDYATGLFTSNVYLTEMPVGLNEPFETTAGRGRSTPHPDALTPIRSDADTATQYLKSCLTHSSPIKSIMNGLVPQIRSSLSQFQHFDSYLSEDDCSTHSENFRSWVSNQSGPWAGCINFMDAHLPYEPNEEYNRWADSDLLQLQSSTESFWDFINGDADWWKCEALSSLYDATILQMDAEIKKIVAHLKDIGEYENTHLVITGDHGEGFGEFAYEKSGVRYAAHAYGIHDSLLHVPLLSKNPHQKQSKRISQLASLTSFYDAVKSSVEGDGEETFISEEMLTTSIERTKQINKHLQNSPNYRGDAYGLYRDAGCVIRKYVAWGEDEVVVTFAKTPKAPILSVDREQHGEVTEKLENVDSGVLRKGPESNENFDDELMQRLEDLGYA